MLVRLLTAAVASLALAAPAEAARSVPAEFYGLTYTGQIADASAEAQDESWELMAANRAGSARTVFTWSRMQSAAGAPVDFSATDEQVRRASEQGLSLLPVITSTPLWAREQQGNWWPERPRDLGDFARALVGRYGPDGSFWEENANLPRMPVRHWQVFNEPGLSRHYAPSLRGAYRAIKGADAGAKVVLAGLTGTPGQAPWDVLRGQYRKHGIGRWFDIAALHMYTGKPENVLEGARLFRRVMRRNGDGRKPLWITEFGITASKGRTEAPRHQRTLRTTDAGMANFLSDAYRLLVKKGGRRNVRLGRAYWHTWASSYEPGGGIFEFAGLNRFNDGELTARPALAAYRKSARQYARR